MPIKTPISSQDTSNVSYTAPFRDLTVIIPTLNEYHNIGRMIEQLVDSYHDVSVLVSDDGSEDGTAQLVVEWSQQNPNVRLLDRKDRPVKGLSISLVDAIKHVQTPYFFVIDSDFQHPPARIRDGFALLTKEGFHVVIGTRLHTEGWSFKRKILSWGATKLAKFSLLLRRRSRPIDVMSGFFGGKTDFITDLIATHAQTIAPSGYKLLFDLLKAIPRSARIGEFFYTFQGRDLGTSKMGRKQMIVFFRSLF